MSQTPTAVPWHDPENDRYVIEVDGQLAGFSEYHLRGHNIYFFYHTHIEDEYVGSGVGSTLVRFALEDVESGGGSIVPLCPFVAGWLERHPEYNRVVNQGIMERIGEFKEAE